MKQLIATISLLLVLGAALAGCSPAAAPQATPTAQSTQAPTAPLATHTPAATATPQATRVLLVASPASNPQALQPLLAGLAEKSGLTLETRPELHPADLSPQDKVVVFLAPPAELGQMLSAAPQTQFVVLSPVDLPDLPAAQNLTLIRENAENQAFLAGFISVLLSTDYRAAGLLPNDQPGLLEAFRNGGQYYCGVCAPGWPLRVYYPVVADLPAAADGAAWQAAAAGLYETQKAEVYYLAPAALRQEVIDYLAGKDQAGRPLRLLGEQTPPEALRAQWAATVRYDVATLLSQHWPDLTAGKAGGVIEARLVVEEVNPELLGAGRMRLINALIEDLHSGAVYPLSVPLQ